MERYLAVHDAYPTDRLQPIANRDQDYRVIGHSDIRKATVWRFVKHRGRLLLQMYQNRAETMVGTVVMYLTIAAHTIPLPPLQGSCWDLAVTRYPSLASTVRTGAVTAANESLPQLS